MLDMNAHGGNGEHKNNWCLTHIWSGVRHLQVFCSLKGFGCCVHVVSVVSACWCVLTVLFV